MSVYCETRDGRNTYVCVRDVTHTCTHGDSRAPRGVCDDTFR